MSPTCWLDRDPRLTLPSCIPWRRRRRYRPRYPAKPRCGTRHLPRV